MSPGECLYAAIDNLDFYFKALITEYYLNDLTLVEINEKFKIPINSIRKDLKQGVKLIQQHCSGWVPKNLKP
jgi:DNA-directed RNA polymerase specialized sigma24 family protein